MASGNHLRVSRAWFSTKLWRFQELASACVQCLLMSTFRHGRVHLSEDMTEQSQATATAFGSCKLPSHRQ